MGVILCLQHLGATEKLLSANVPCVDCPYGLDGIALPAHCLGFICMIYFNVCHYDDIAVASKQMLVALLTNCFC